MRNSKTKHSCKREKHHLTGCTSTWTYPTRAFVNVLADAASIVHVVLLMKCIVYVFLVKQYKWA